MRPHLGKVRCSGGNTQMSSMGHPAHEGLRCRSISKDDDTAELVARLARLRGPSKQAAVKLADKAFFDELSGEEP